MKNNRPSSLDEQRYRVLIDNAPEAVVIFDLDEGKFIDFNENAMNFFKLSREELLKKGPIDLSPAFVYGHEAGSYANQFIQEAMRGGNPFFEWIHIDRNGREIPCEVRVIRLPPYEKKLVRGSIIDKSGHKEMESALKESKERLSLALNATGLGCFDLYPFENKLIWDERMHEICGLPMDSDIDRNAYFFTILHPEDRERVEQHYRSLMDSKNKDTSFENTYRIIRDGEVVYVDTKGILIRNDKGEVLRTIGTLQDVTARKIAEEQLSFQAALLENISDAVIVTDKDFKIKSLNPAAVEMFDWQIEEALDKPFVEVIPTTYIDGDRESAIKELLEKGIWKGEVIQKNKAGEDLNILSSVKKINSPDDSNVGYIGVNRNITDRKKAEEALKESEEHYRRLVEKSHDLIWEIDAEGNITYINDVVKEFYGYEPDELTGIPFPELVAPYALEESMQVFQNVLQSGEGALNIETEMLHKNGSIVIIDSRITPIFDNDENIIGIMGTSQNITERKRAEEKIMEITNRLQLSTKAAKVGIWDWNIEKGILFWDDTMKELYCIADTDPEISYEFWMNTIHPDDQGFVQKQIETFLTIGTEFSYEFRIVLHDQSVRYIKAHGNVYPNEAGDPRRVIGTNWDFTTEKEAEQEKIRSARLELKNKQLEEFAYVASHEMQEPLRTIKGLSEVLSRRYADDLDERGREYLHLITQASSRMRDQIKALLEYSRIGRRKKKINVDCNTLVTHVLHDLTSQVLETNARIEKGQLPVLYGYRSELRVLFQNLISNAIKFRKSGTIPEIEISAVKENGNWKFSVSDNGIGIDPEAKEAIFAIFHRLHSKEEYEGSGIGLAHCRKIVGIHGGDIWLESVPGKGSVFYFTIPSGEKESPENLQKGKKF